MNNPEKVNYNAFQVDDKDHIKENANQGLRLSAKKSRFAKNEDEQKSPTKEEFEKEVRQFKARDMDQRNKIAQLSSQYKGILLDKTHEDNKSPIQKDLEASIIKELATLGLQLDNDQDQPEGIGSIGLCNLLLQANILQRDVINKISYEIVKLNRTVAQLHRQISDAEDDE
jgi:hypothetical protein